MQRQRGDIKRGKKKIRRALCSSPNWEKNVIEGENGHQCLILFRSKEFEDFKMSMGFRNKIVLGENCKTSSKRIWRHQ